MPLACPFDAGRLALYESGLNSPPQQPLVEHDRLVSLPPASVKSGPGQCHSDEGVPSYGNGPSRT
jgi:hypothetical protein